MRCRFFLTRKFRGFLPVSTVAETKLQKGVDAPECLT
jgi:hypothetical protein